MEQKPKLEWEGKTTATLTNTTADQAWSLMKNFTDVDKILPAVQTCYKVEGVDGEPGCVRYVATGKVTGPGEVELFMWAKERLIETDPVNRFYRYEIVESSVGFRRYFGRLGAEEGGGGGGGGGGGECVIEWSYVADPIEGWAKEEFDGFLGRGMEVLARRIEEFKG
ncbi:Lachrymatory-factor synthase [Acorus gramineus]|uniref:Lachrymatory-factor synthase n=1 Tax=Acorus gramineus TaxID=55184 RepID=A0AAV9ATJ5_ACOGR|nr:Lachrymatory-factor synthase [Acorus gramineus]